MWVPTSADTVPESAVSFVMRPTRPRNPAGVWDSTDSAARTLASPVVLPTSSVVPAGRDTAGRPAGAFERISSTRPSGETR